MDEHIRVVIADDHPLFRDGVRQTLSDFANCAVVAECANADEALEAVRRYLPDIILLDIGMPGGGIEAVRRIAAACRVVRILMLTDSENESDVMGALEFGASGYILKGIGGEEFAAIIKSVHQGGNYVSPSLGGNTLFDDIARNRSERSDLSMLLNAREDQILDQVTQGLNNKEIALALNVSEHIVKRHMTSIFGKLKVRNRVEAALKVRSPCPRRPRSAITGEQPHTR